MLSTSIEGVAKLAVHTLSLVKMLVAAVNCGAPSVTHCPVLTQDRHEFSQLVTAIRQQYNENGKTIERTWGGGIMGVKSQAATAKMQRAIEKEAAKKALM